MGAALKRDRLGLRRRLEKRHKRWVGQRAIQRAAAVKAEQAHRRPAAKADIAACRHVGRIGGKDQIKLDRDVGLECLRRRHRAAQVEFLLHRKDKMQRWPLLCVREGARDFKDHRAPGAVVNGSASDPASCKPRYLWPIDNRRADHHSRGPRFLSRAKTGIDQKILIGQNLVFFLRRRRVMAFVTDDGGHILASADALPVSTKVRSRVPPIRSVAAAGMPL